MKTLHRVISLTALLFTIFAALSVQAQEDSAQLRFAHLVDDADAVDIFVDGEILLEALEWRVRSDFFPLDGMITVAMAPSGEGLDAAIAGPMDVELTAAHKYTIGMIGKTELGNVQLVVIDETEELAAHPPSETQTAITVINGLSGADTIENVINGEVVIEALAYGEVTTITVPSGAATFEWNVSVSDNKDENVRGGSGFADPYGNWMAFFMGLYSGPDGRGYGLQTFEEMSVNIVEFLPALSKLEIESIGTFDTLVEAIEIAGLTDTLSQEGEFVLLAPNDAAFAALPDGMLEELLADPDALADLLLYHVIDGIGDYEPGETPVTTLNGSDLMVIINDDGAFVNDARLGLGSSPTNGLILFIDVVLIPPDDA